MHINVMAVFLIVELQCERKVTLICVLLLFPLLLRTDLGLVNGMKTWGNIAAGFMEELD